MNNELNAKILRRAWQDVDMQLIERINLLEARIIDLEKEMDMRPTRRDMESFCDTYYEAKR